MTINCRSGFTLNIISRFETRIGHSINTHPMRVMISQGCHQFSCGYCPEGKFGC